MKIPRRWQELWQRLRADGDGAAVHADLLARYSEPHRHYHNHAHIQHCLREFDTARHLAEHPDCVELALWFHDAVYDSKAKDNEEKSAQLADVALAGVDASVCERVRALILITQHKQPPVTPDEQLVVDCDLAILGQSEQALDAYEQQIRQEYAWVAEPEFRKGRAAVLNHFLARSAVYATDFFRAKYEAAARRNLQRSLAALK